MDHSNVTKPCAQCSAPLADDQRYCLQCGEPGPHVSGPLSVKPATEKPLQTAPGSPGSTPALPSVPPVIPGAQSSTRNNSLALLAGVGVLLLAMGVGVLIGRAGAGSSAKAPPAQVISLGAAAGAGGAAGAATTPTTATPAAPSPTSTTKKGAKPKEPAGTGASITKPAPPSAVQNLRSGGSGQSYEQKSKSLPNVVSTG